MADRIKLRAELVGANAATYAVSVAAGRNADLLAILNGPHASAKSDAVVPRSQVRAAIGDAARALTAAQLQRLQLLLVEDLFDFGNSADVTELRAIITDANAIARLAAMAKRPATVAEAAGIGVVAPEDLWAVLPTVPGSLHKVQLDDAAADYQYAERRAIENRMIWNAEQASAAKDPDVQKAYDEEVAALEKQLEALGGPAPRKP